MGSSVQQSEKGLDIILGSFFVAAGVLCLLLSFSLLPVIGGIIGLPCIGIGIVFLAKHNRRLPSS